MKILIINGPNLNLLGTREPELYGNLSFDLFLENLKEAYANIEISYVQSNVEGELINAIQDAAGSVNAIVINAGGYTHTSVAIADALKAVVVPYVEVHISNIFAREEFRHKSLISACAKGIITGFGLNSYKLALDYFSRYRD